MVSGTFSLGTACHGANPWETNRRKMSLTPFQCQSGFTLIEVLAAIALLALVFAVALSAIGGAARNAANATALDAAVEHAQSLLAGQGLTAPLEVGDQSGAFADGMHWSLETTRLARPAPRASDENGTGFGGAQTGGVLMVQAGAIDIYQLQVAVRYAGGRTLRLATERAQAARGNGP